MVGSKMSRCKDQAISHMIEDDWSNDFESDISVADTCAGEADSDGESGTNVQADSLNLREDDRRSKVPGKMDKRLQLTPFLSTNSCLKSLRRKRLRKEWTKDHSSDSGESGDFSENDSDCTSIHKLCKTELIDKIHLLNEQIRTLTQELKFYKSLDKLAVGIPVLLNEVNCMVQTLKKDRSQRNDCNMRHQSCDSGPSAFPFHFRKVSSVQQRRVKTPVLCHIESAVSTDIPKTVSSESGASPNAFLTFGSKEVPSLMVQELNHTKLSLLVSELCSLVFTPEELALSSMKGRKSNAVKTQFHKRAIDEDKVNAITEYVANYFKINQEDAKKEVTKAIGFKLNNFSKTDVGRRIIAEYTELLKMGTPLSSDYRA